MSNLISDHKNIRYTALSKNIIFPEESSIIVLVMTNFKI